MKPHLIVALSLGLLVPATGSKAQEFGNAAAVVDEDVLYSQPDAVGEPGAVFVYRLSGDGWREAARLTASDGTPGDRFGISLAADGGTILVGAVGADSGRGAAYVFERAEDGSWRETSRLEAPGGARGDRLGARVAIHGDMALVGYGFRPDGSPIESVLVFRRAPSGWRPSGALTREEAGSSFGFGFALGESFAAVAVAGSDPATPGAVLVYPAIGTEWGEPAILRAPAPQIGFGYALAFHGERLLVGSPSFEQGRGGVFVYRRAGDEWEQVGHLQAGETAKRGFFGSSIVTRGEEVWVGAHGGDGLAGAVYRIQHSATGERVEALVLTAPGLDTGAGPRVTLALGEEVAALGLPGGDNGTGKGVILTRQDGGWALADVVFTDLPSLPAVVGRPVPCDGDGVAAGFPCGNVDLVAFLPAEALGGGRGARLNDVWGWTDPQSGREYALVGRTDGTAFVDVSDPVNPVLVGSLPKTEGSPSSAWRDIKVYRDHAFIVADGAEAHGMQVFDLTRLRNVTQAPATFQPDTTYHNIHSAHNIVINEDSGFAYVVGASAGGETCGGGLHMIDIHDPENPVFAGCFSDPSTGFRKTGYTHDAQCVLYHGPDADYQGREICFGSNETALSIADVTDKQNPVAVATAEYPNVGYTHQGWLTEDHRYFLMDDEGDEGSGLVDGTRTLIWDVSDLDDPVLLTEYLNPNSSAIDHNQYVVGDKVFQSNYVSGLRVLDISDIANPREVGFFDTVPTGPDEPSFEGSWSNYPFFQSGVIVVTSIREGLFLLRYRPAGDRPVSGRPAGPAPGHPARRPL